MCSLDAIAHGIDFADTPRALVATDARRREIYWATYDKGTRQQGPEVIAPGELELAGSVDIISIPVHLGAKLPEAFHGVEKLTLKPLPANLVAVADLNATPEPLVPMYLRRPDAKEPTPKPKSAAIPEVEL